MKTAMDIIEEINNEQKAQISGPGILFWLLLICVGFTSGMMGAMVYAFIMSPISK